MEIKKFNITDDLQNLEDYLRREYNQNKNMTSWLPERLNDLIFRMDRQYLDKGDPKSSNYIYLWIDNGKIVGCILPDGDAIYMSITNGYEILYQSILKFAEEKCLPLFKKEEDGKIDFLVIANDSLKYRNDILLQNGYKKDEDGDYDNYIYPANFDASISLPEGFRLVYGEDYPNEINKWSACNLGFHPELESPDYQNDMGAYNERKKSPMYKDSFECLIVDDNTTEKNNVCSYCFVYVDKQSKTAFIEPTTSDASNTEGLSSIIVSINSSITPDEACCSSSFV